jgi:hypothetical protein
MECCDSPNPVTTDSYYEDGLLVVVAVCSNCGRRTETRERI